MEKLISELMRLYLPPQPDCRERLARHLRGEETLAIGPDENGMTRVVAIAFDKAGQGDDALHWTQLCEVARVLQVRYGFPAPAVSVSGGEAYHLWLSLQAPVPAADAQRFETLLRLSCFPDLPAGRSAAHGTVALPPSLNAGTGRWAAFINPGMGASFAEEPGLEMAPPHAGQAAFLEHVHSVGVDEFRQALQALGQAAGPAPEAPAVPPARQDRTGLLLSDATLEDIVRHLHAKHIEPTFRYLMPRAP